MSDRRRYLEEALRRAQRRGYMRELFPEQLAFIRDKSRTKAALCTRRAGKTWSACAHLLDAAEANPGTTSVYIALTRSHAKQLMWTEMLRFDARHELGITFNHSELIAKLPNGSTIFVIGANDAQTIERLRGGKYILAIIDEAASFRVSILETLVREILRPALIDLKGTLCLIGTPGAACVGMFYDATMDPSTPFSVHRWSVKHNPHIPHQLEELEREKAANRWTDDHPSYRREWLGEWVRDSLSLVYHYESARNGVDMVPSATAGKVLGIDYGVVDATAFAIWVWEPNKKEAILTECWSQTGLIPSDAARITLELNARHHFDRIVGDVGGLGKGFAEEARQRFSVPIMPAQKTNKRGYIELMNGDLKSGLIRVVKPGCLTWIEEAQICQWDDKREKEDPRFSNHCLDAALYGWREVRAFAEEPAENDNDQEKTPEEVAAQIREQHLDRWRRKKEDAANGIDWFQRRGYG